jgi:diguanylate cyclase (GGDEF)-like protein/PAS domain S-box-containing protein
MRSCPPASRAAWRASLRTRLLLLALATGIVLALVASAVQLALEYRRGREDIDALMDHIARTTLGPLANGVWQMDSVQVNLLLAGIAQLPDVRGARVDTTLGERYRDGRSVAEGTGFSRSFELRVPDSPEPIGQLVVEVTLENLRSRVLENARMALASQVLASLLLAALLVAFAHRLVTRHLDRIAAWSREQAGGERVAPLGLDRRRTLPDELGLVVDALNAMHGAVEAELSARRDAEAALFSEKERLQVTLNSIADAVICADVNGCVTYLNPAAEQFTGWPHAEAAGRRLGTVFNVVNDITREPIPDPVGAVCRHGQAVGLSLSSQLVSRDGTVRVIEESAAPIRDAIGGITGIVIVFRDVTAAREMEHRVLHQATHDALTGLPNRAMLNEQLAHTIALASRKQWQVALMFIDLDRFKVVNDSLGHAVGDQLLQQVAGRLQAAVRESDLVCRQGGDEFLVLLPDAATDESVTQVAERVLQSLDRPFAVDGRELSVTPSIGIAVFPRDGEDMDGLVKSADAAMYAAKEAGRNCHRFFSRDMQARAMERLALEASLRQALARDEFVLHFQPQVDTDAGRITGAEALVRWAHPDGEVIPPARFIALAEEAGLIVPLGHWVLRAATRAAASWRVAGHETLTVSVNVSAVQLRDPGIVAAVAEALAESGLRPAALELELTESVMAASAEIVERVGALKDLGVRIALDDFGTGYSALAYLKRFPLDTLKIDRAFVRDAHRNRHDAAIAKAILGLGQSMSLDVVAEGVESAEQLEFLRRHGCRVMQGYHFSPPVGAAQFERMLAREATPALTLGATG